MVSLGIVIDDFLHGLWFRSGLKVVLIFSICVDVTCLETRETRVGALLVRYGGNLAVLFLPKKLTNT